MVASLAVLLGADSSLAAEDGGMRLEAQPRRRAIYPIPTARNTPILIYTFGGPISANRSVCTLHVTVRRVKMHYLV